jgi:hypothetical protein
VSSADDIMGAPSAPAGDVVMLDDVALGVVYEWDALRIERLRERLPGDEALRDALLAGAERERADVVETYAHVLLACLTPLSRLRLRWGSLVEGRSK